MLTNKFVMLPRNELLYRNKDSFDHVAITFGNSGGRYSGDYSYMAPKVFNIKKGDNVVVNTPEGPKRVLVTVARDVETADFQKHWGVKLISFKVTGIVEKEKQQLELWNRFEAAIKNELNNGVQNV